MPALGAALWEGPMKLVSLVRVVCGACALGLLAGGARSAEVEWRYFTYFPVNDKPAQLTRAFADDVEKATNGRLKIKVFAAGELPYKAPDVVKAVATNQVHMGDVAVGFASGDLPELNVLSLPFLCTSYNQFDKAIAAISATVDETFAKKFGVKVAVHWTMPPQNFWLNRPIGGFADLKGLKVRTWNPEQVAMIRLLEGSPVSINSAEVIPALERRVIDGAITSALSANDWRAYEIVKTGYLANVTMGHQVMMINEAELAKLPADLRDTLLKKTQDWTAKYAAMSREGDEEARKNLAANKVTLVEPKSEDREKARAMLRPMWDEWATKHGSIGRTLLERAMAACGASS
jgi:TRAP-type C4-dicarboxylate transport system substrate-binding protein